MRNILLDVTFIHYFGIFQEQIFSENLKALIFPGVGRLFCVAGVVHSTVDVRVGGGHCGGGGKGGEGGGRHCSTHPGLEGKVGVGDWITSQSAQTVTIRLHGDLKQDIIDQTNINIIDTA